MRRLLAIFCLLATTLAFTANAQQAEFSTQQPIMVFADSHGDYGSLLKLLRGNNIIDDQNNWAAGKTQVVSVGDYLDRGAQSRKILDLLMALQQQAEAAGGYFHTLLGNHEVMNLTNDLRYVSDGEYAAFADDEPAQLRQNSYTSFLKWKGLAASEQTLADFDNSYPAGYFALQAAFAPDGYYGRWLLQQPIIIRINDNLFMHGGLSPKLQGKSINEVNTILKQELHDYLHSWRTYQQATGMFDGMSDRQRERHSKAVADTDEFAEQAHQFYQLSLSTVLGSDSPTWYRGNAYCHQFNEQPSLQADLGKFNAKRLFLGHTVTKSKKVVQRFNGTVYLMDTGMNEAVYGGNGSIARIENGNISVSYNNPVSEPLIVNGPDVMDIFPHGWSNLDVEAALKSGKVTQVKDLKTGVTRPQKLTLEYDGKVLNALFKVVDTDPRLPSRRWEKKFDFADRYQYDIAAYEISKMMGLDTVPVSVEREIDGRVGVMQFWIEDSVSGYQLEEQNRGYNGYCDYAKQTQLMNIFDTLILNVDRNNTNILFDEYYWQLWMIDHSRAFGTGSLNRKAMRQVKQGMNPVIKDALMRLNRDEADEVLGPWLHREQIKALFKRRDALVR